MRNFNEAHDKYHAELSDESAIRDSIEYFESVKRIETAVFQSFDAWLQSAPCKLQEELNVRCWLPAVFIRRFYQQYWFYQIGLSQSSTASNARLRESAKKATLSVEVAALKTRQNIQLEELLLKQKKENFELETELAKAEAEERVYKG